MEKPKFSIILNLYDPTRWQRQMTYACLIAIRRFTDEPYEIIVVDNEPITDIVKDDPYGRINLDRKKVIVNKKNKTVYKSFNQGAKLAKSDILIFMHNDVFCVEKTLNNLVTYLDRGFDVAYPIPIALTREQVLDVYNSDPMEIKMGWRDTGCMAIEKESFERVGKWDERYHMIGEKEMYGRFNRFGLKEIANTNSFITHMCAINNYSKDDKLYNKQMAEDAKLSEEII